MRYLQWKKQTRKKYKQIEKELNLEKIKVIIPLEHNMGVHIKPRLKILVIPFNHMKKIRAENDFKYSLIDITEAFIYHELGHHYQYITYKEPIVGPKAIKYQFLRKAYNNNYMYEERIRFLEIYAELTMEVENEAWEIGFNYFKGNTILYHLLKEQSLKTHKDGLIQTLELEKKRFLK